MANMALVVKTPHLKAVKAGKVTNPLEPNSIKVHFTQRRERAIALSGFFFRDDKLVPFVPHAILAMVRSPFEPDGILKSAIGRPSMPAICEDA